VRPILFTLFGHDVRAWSAGVVLATLVSAFVAWRSRPPGLLSSSQFLDVCLLTAFGAGLGARLSAAWATGTLDVAHAVSLLAFWRGGNASAAGAAVGALPLLLAYARWARLDPAALLDLLIPCGVLGAGIHRVVGCFLTGCCAGVPTTLPWGVRFPGHDSAVHPTQLYLGFGCLLVFAGARAMRVAAPGTKAAAVVGAFSVLSLAVTPVRLTEAVPRLGPLGTSQIAHLATLVGALVWLVACWPARRRALVTGQGT
jgi:prolipoprotein diacylglyceryltransferase